MPKAQPHFIEKRFIEVRAEINTIIGYDLDPGKQIMTITFWDGFKADFSFSQIAPYLVAAVQHRCPNCDSQVKFYIEGVERKNLLLQCDNCHRDIPVPEIEFKAH